MVVRMFLFNLDPIDQTFVAVAIQFAIYTVIGVLATYLVVWTTHYKAEKREIGLLAHFLAGPVEELLFRGLPLYFFGPLGGVVATVIWAFLHGRAPQILFCLIIGIFYLRMWLSGMWLEAIFIHSMWDVCMWSVGADAELKKVKKEKESLIRDLSYVSRRALHLDDE